MRISDWSSDVCSSDLASPPRELPGHGAGPCDRAAAGAEQGDSRIGEIEIPQVMTRSRGHEIGDEDAKQPADSNLAAAIFVDQRSDDGRVEASEAPAERYCTLNRGPRDRKSAG